MSYRVLVQVDGSDAGVPRPKLSLPGQHRHVGRGSGGGAEWGVERGERRRRGGGHGCDTRCLVACGVLIGLGQGVWFGSGGQRIRADGGGEFWTTYFLVCG
jgi:hypothetical protein